MKILVIGSGGQLGRECLSELDGLGDLRGVDFPEIDLANRSSAWKVLERVSPQVIINCAAYTAVDACETDPACWPVNAEGPGFLAAWTQKRNAFLVHVSTDYVFDGEKPLFNAYMEEDQPAPVSAYGRSKLAGEQAIAASGADFAILRTAWLYGIHGKNFLKTMLCLAIQNPEREIRVVNDQFGSPTPAKTLARH